MDSILLSSKKMDYCTPQDFFDELDAEFIITDGDLESNELNYCPKCGAKMDGGKDDGI